MPIFSGVFISYNSKMARLSFRAVKAISLGGSDNFLVKYLHIPILREFHHTHFLLAEILVQAVGSFFHLIRLKNVILNGM